MSCRLDEFVPEDKVEQEECNYVASEEYSINFILGVKVVED
jgi:hypothetical protein